MIPLVIDGATRRLAVDQKEYIPLSIRDCVIEGIQVMQSKWEPLPWEVDKLVGNDGALVYRYMSAYGLVVGVAKKPSQAEVEALIAGGTVLLTVPGHRWPPCLVGTVTADELAALQIPDQPCALLNVIEPAKVA